jgi:hypothetical protein
MPIMVDKVKLTRAQYDALTPLEKGYAHYFQAEWPGSEIPKEMPYPPGSAEAVQFGRGSQMAMIACTDVEDE